MDWSHATPDEIDRGFDHFGGLQAAATAHICDLIRAADAGHTWMRDGARTLTEWVGLKLRIRPSSAAKLVRVARRLQELPFLASRFACGDLSLEQVEAISEMATPETEETLIEEALSLSNSELERKARRSRPKSDDHDRTTWERRRLVRQWNLDESELKLWGNLPAAEGQILDRAIDARVDRMAVNPETGTFDSLETRSADALVEMAATGGGEGSLPPQITVFAELDALTTNDKGVAELECGALITNETARRLSCDAVVETAVMEDNIVVGVGRNSRTIPGWLRRLVLARAGGCCQYPGCTNRRWLQAHHIQHWADEGPTDLENLIILCGFHHRFVHEHRWHVGGPADRPVFRKPDWSIYPPPPTSLDRRLAALVGVTAST